MNKKERKYRDLCMRETRDPVKSKLQLSRSFHSTVFVPVFAWNTAEHTVNAIYGVSCFSLEKVRKKTRKRWCYIKEEGIWVDGDNENAPKSIYIFRCYTRAAGSKGGCVLYLNIGHSYKMIVKIQKKEESFLFLQDSK